MPGLAASRWASRDRARQTALEGSSAGGFRPSNQPRSPAEELTRYTKIVRRLKWKLPYLAAGYHQATAGSPAADASALMDDNAHAARAEAELMFKLDFFEYYMLLERALVHLLGVFGIAISRDFLGTIGAAEEPARRANPDGAGAANGTAAPAFGHRYHANVLEALDSATNPLHEVLGAGDVRRQLARAKDLRNRWKNADDHYDPDDGAAHPAGRMPAAGPLPLESYDLERILAAIFEGFDRAFVVAERFVAEERTKAEAAAAAANGDVGPQPMDWDLGTEEEQWEFMVDAMDWESV